MPQQPIEMILTRQLVEHLAMPTFMVDAEGRVLDFNDAARRVLGDRLEAARKVTAHGLAEVFQARDETGALMKPEALPLVIALETRHPAHARMAVMGADDQSRELAVTAMPLVGQGDRFLGAIAFFWEVAR